jgi:hypothetical protein
MRIRDLSACDYAGACAELDGRGVQGGRRGRRITRTAPMFKVPVATAVLGIGRGADAKRTAASGAP